MNFIYEGKHVEPVTNLQENLVAQVVPLFDLKLDITVDETIHGHIFTIPKRKFFNHEEGETARLMPNEIMFIGNLVENYNLRWIEVYKDKVMMGV